MRTIQALILGFGLGAGAMFLLDPKAGRRRRAQGRAKAVRFGHALEAIATRSNKAAQRRRDRAQGRAHEARARQQPERPVSDEILVERVRAALGRRTSHPRAIVASARNGRVTLSGPILAREVDWLLDTVESVRGVKSVENHLEVHDTPGNVPALQGERRHTTR